MIIVRNKLYWKGVIFLKHILVCFKLIHDYDQVLSADWPSFTSGNPDFSYVRQIYNCFDESALELALRAKDFYTEQNRNVHLTALTIADDSCTSFLKTLYAIGYDQAVRIEPTGDLSFSPLTVAKQIASYIELSGISFDALLFGEKAAPFDSGQVPYYVAQLLNLPAISNITSFEAVKSAYLVTTVQGNILQKIQITTPAVYLIGNCRQTYLRVPTLREKARASKKEISCYTFSENHEQSLCPSQVIYESKERTPHLIRSESSTDSARQLLELIRQEVSSQ